jgi:hypothetical protein
MSTFIKNLLLIFTLSLSTMALGEGIFGYEENAANAPVTGSASDQGANKAAPTLAKCEKPFGTIAVSEPQSYVAQALAQYKLPPPTGLLRLIIQQSNCFVVVERGLAIQNMIQERALSENGQLQNDSNVGKGQLVAADFILTPTVAFSDSNSGGVGISAIANHLGAAGSIIGALAGGIKFKQAQTTLMLADARSGIQVAAAEGNVEKTDWGIGGALGGPAGGLAAGGYTITAEGKVIAAALLNNYNNIVQSIKNKPDLIAARAPEPSKQNAKNSVQASAGLNSGDVIRPKINAVKVFAEANEKSKVVGKLTKQDELIYLGDENNGFIKIDGALSGWVDKRMIAK